jgi:hypothetical protein
MSTDWEMCCPQCGDENNIAIEGEVGGWVYLTADGCDADAIAEGASFEEEFDGYHWADDSVARCTECGHEGTVKQFEDAYKGSLNGSPKNGSQRQPQQIRDGGRV